MPKSGFKETNSIKKQHPKDHPEGGNYKPWECKQPQYDERSSCFVNTGTHYGVGHRQPVGHEGDPAQHASTLPTDRRNVTTMRVDEVG